jgi:general secretion pathway protein E
MSDMNNSSLSDLIAKVRAQTPAVNGGLWNGLLAASGLRPEQFKEQLWASQGVMVDLRGALIPLSQTSVIQDASVMLVKTSTGLSLMLCEDPWSEASLSAFTRFNDGQLNFALALPGQSASLSGAIAPQRSEQNHQSMLGNDASSLVVSFVDQAITQATVDGASDIHFETNRQGIGIKYRLDGVMVSGARLDQPELSEQVISRIKVLAELDITERRKPQDGRFRWGGQGQGMDLRVSIMPSVFGEDAVLRLLDKAQLRDAVQKITLDGLGFEPKQAEIVRELAARPHGMLLVTGPTGSGKTTTLYATLSEVNSGIEKTITIEDPVEYELAGVLQIPVNERKGLTFATGLRSILRHDPDKILVGEIRDSETAEIAVQAALTGHVVFTTVHANSLFDVLGRFQHFAIDPFAFASSLNGIVVQRLLRKLCEYCADWRELTLAETQRFERLGLIAPKRVAAARGCPHCRQTGYRGRFVVAQVHTVDDTLRELVLRKSSIAEIKALMQQQEGQSLLFQAIGYAAKGKTSLEEVARVVGWS